MPILNSQNINHIPEEIGVYKIFAFNHANLPINVNRFCGTDTTGLLYIGKTDRQNLRKRLYQFYTSAHPEMVTHNHSGAQKYFRNQAIRNHLGNNHVLGFEFEIHDFPNIRESELLNEYFLQFGEYPPLNK